MKMISKKIKKNLKNIVAVCGLVTMFIFFVVLPVYAQPADLNPSAAPLPTCTAGPDGYCLLAPIGGKSVITNAELPDYFNLVYKIGIGIAGVLAVIMLVFGGIQYMSTDALSGKSDGKDKMTRAILGLILALGSFVILNTVNPQLLDFTFNIDKLNIEVESDTPHSADSSGKFCNGTVQGGASWASIAGALATLPSGVTTNGQECTVVGQGSPGYTANTNSCTSVRGLNVTGLSNLRAACPACELVVTGGTECWLHSKKTAHKPTNQVVDLRKTPSLETFVTNPSHTTQTTLPNGWIKYTFTSPSNLAGAIFTDETTGQPHFHVSKW